MAYHTEAIIGYAHWPHPEQLSEVTQLAIVSA